MNGAEKMSLGLGGVFGFVIGVFAMILVTDCALDQARQEPVWDSMQVAAAARAGMVVPTVTVGQLQDMAERMREPCPEPAPCQLSEIALETPFCFGCYGMDSPDELSFTKNHLSLTCSRGLKVTARALELR